MISIWILWCFIQIVPIAIIDGGSSSGNIMRQMWMTPIQVINILSPSSTTILSMNQSSIESLYLEIINQFHIFKNQINDIPNPNSTPLSDIFYIYQQKKDAEFRQCLLTSSSFSSCNQETVFDLDLYSLFYESVKIFLTESFLDASIIANYTIQDLYLKIFIWSSVHNNGSYHVPHTHANSMISGVLYIR